MLKIRANEKITKLLKIKLKKIKLKYTKIYDILLRIKINLKITIKIIIKIPPSVKAKEKKN